MASHNEIEIKFRVADPRVLNRRLRKSGFHLLTRRTREMNTLYDLPGQILRKRGELLRLRKYGPEWVLTNKAKGKAGRHEKYRAEWSDSKGHVVVDETPIGNFGEIEGPARWIDRTAQLLEIRRGDYITATYADLFLQWKKQAGSPANEMTFQAIKSETRRR
jgi:adenylate cyclase class 2